VKTNKFNYYSFSLLIRFRHVSALHCHLQGAFLVPKILWMGVSSDVVRVTHHVSRHNTSIHNILSTAPQLSISHKALGTLPEDDNLMPKHVEATIHN
jgi:hypothetical protein